MRFDAVAAADDDDGERLRRPEIGFRLRRPKVQ